MTDGYVTADERVQDSLTTTTEGRTVGTLLIVGGYIIDSGR